MAWDYWRFLTILSLAGFIGLLFDQMVTFLFLASFFYALWLQRSWFQLLKWMQRPKKNACPTAVGVIDDVCREVESVRLQNSSRKKKLGGYLKRFQSATSALPDAIVVLGEYGEVEWANDSAKDLIGVRWPKDSNVRVNNLIRDPDFQQLLIDHDELGRTVVVSSPVNSAIQLEIKIVKYMGSGRMLLARDMTQIVKLQKMRRDFVANVSHELRTPLTVLRGYLEMFDADDTAQQQWQAALPAMKQQAERMSEMLQELLSLSRLETGEKELQNTSTDIAKLLKDIAQDAKQLKQYNEQNIQLKIETDKWLLVDAEEIRSAISNLVINAVKYTPAKCDIVIRWAIEKDKALIEVSDSGEGIAEYHLERLTERFYRVDSGRSQDVGGTGLGLAIVKHVLQRHDAELKITSDLGNGARFSCYFPKSKIVEKPSV